MTSNPETDVTAPLVQPTGLGQGWGVYGHGWALNLLAQAAQSGPRHAYLFLGPAQLGKTTLARSFAQALLCTGEGERPCAGCRACRLMGNGGLQGGHPDFRLIQPVDSSGEVDRADGTLRVEQAEAIIHEATLRPLEARYKIFLIQEMQSANTYFANKLLKTLEEPPPHVILLVTATERSLLLPTIVSRCQVLDLRPVDIRTAEQALIQRWQADAQQARLLARLSNGRMGWAVQRLQDADMWTQRQEMVAQVMQLAAADRVDRLAFAADLAANRDNRRLFDLLALWISWWRDVMLAQAGSPESCSNIDHLSDIQTLARSLSAQAVQAYLYTLERIEKYLHHTTNTRLALDVLALRMPRA
ncbi:MAG: AAA family ATPase [Caldilineaceae bacterium]|nr:AAA family ATPase [Caldilineaceae bacterium]MBP8107031.1 AAA family ATPase [Caldilineaceae bacterium]MBP8121975.1 AAA family ATPase [Caldilineaceae bacterium]MBP9072660.1 AAA family ATPase [Caldilineaceae bacterium]